MVKVQHLCDVLLETASVLNVVDSYPVELLFPIRAGRTKHQIDKKGRDKGRCKLRTINMQSGHLDGSIS